MSASILDERNTVVQASTAPGENKNKKAQNKNKPRRKRRGECPPKA
jgi:hypothetical protein